MVIHYNPLFDENDPMSNKSLQIKNITRFHDVNNITDDLKKISQDNV